MVTDVTDATSPRARNRPEIRVFPGMSATFEAVVLTEGERDSPHPVTTR